MGQPGGSFAVSFAPRPDAVLNLICLPWASAGSAPFHPWSAALPPAVELFAIRLPGREKRLLEPHTGSVASVVDELVGALGQLPPRRYVLVGHCLGAILGFELARALRDRGLDPPAQLIVVNSAGPQTFTAARTRVDPVAELDAYRAIIDPRMFDLVRPGIEGDLRMVNEYVYRPGPPLDLPIVVLQSTAEPMGDQPGQDWGAATTSRCDFRELDTARLYPDGAWMELLASIVKELDFGTASEAVLC